MTNPPACASFYRQPLKYFHLYVLCLRNRYEQVWYRTSGNRRTFCDGLPLISKVFERVAPLTPSNITFYQVNPCQHGYVAGRSCVTQFIEVLEHIGWVLDLGKQISVIYLDISKTFDNISHKRLL